MHDLITYMNDMIVIAFDLLLYITMCPFRKDTGLPKVFCYIGSILILFAYFYAVYILHLPAAASSAFCMGIPSFLLFLYYAKYRDCRFILTFCFVDSITFIVAFICRVMIVYLPYGNGISIALSLTVFSILLYFARKYANRYQVILEEVNAGWGIMALSSAIIYFALVFTAGYPKPMIERLEYVPVWIVFAFVVLSCYVVFIHSIIKTKKIRMQNETLLYEKKLFHLAFQDGLTNLYNRSSYIEKINELERSRDQYRSIGFIVADINRFKEVNDTFGHFEGDCLLKKAAESFSTVFEAYRKYIFRMGGDEFLIILPDTSESEVQQRIEQFCVLFDQRQDTCAYRSTLSFGYKIMSTTEQYSLEAAYIEADKQMYRNKQHYYENIKKKP